jgi:hypothetical protein
MEHEAYYATTAQVIPILLLVTVFELRQWTVEPGNRLRTVFSSTVAIVAVLGAIAAEYGALNALRTGNDPAWRRALIDWVILVQLITIWLAALPVIFARFAPRSDAASTPKDEEAPR